MNVNENRLKQNKETLSITCPFGDIHYNNEDIIFFPEGLYGYETCHYFIIHYSLQFLPFFLLICLDEPNMVFPLMEPKSVIQGYLSDIYANKNVNIFVIVSIGESNEQMTANFQAPILIDNRKQEARQIILMESEYSLNQPLFSNRDQ